MIAELRQVSKQYRDHAALRDVTLSIPEGSVFALVGSNGAGKTTALKVLMNLITPTQGHALVLGTDSRKLSPKQYARIGYVSENQKLPHRMRVAEYLRYLRPFYPGWDTALEARLVEQLRLPLERRTGDLSHGMHMKMLLACAMPYRPELLVLDEPFNGLDPVIREDLMDTLIEQCGHMTILISSHELSEIETFVSHIGLMEAGRLILQETIADLSSRLRAVRVTLQRPAPAPANLPREWLNVQTVGNVLSFVETRFSEDAFNSRLNGTLAGVRDVDVQPMDLRRTYITLARAAQAEAIR
jgi:ABC-2 type transport system ATP-binding protein